MVCNTGVRCLTLDTPDNTPTHEHVSTYADANTHKTHLEIGGQHVVVLLHNLVVHLLPVLLGLLLHVLRDFYHLKLGAQLLTCLQTHT